jgi:hypothetical protein
MKVGANILMGRMFLRQPNTKTKNRTKAKRKTKTNQRFLYTNIITIMNEV